MAIVSLEQLPSGFGRRDLAGLLAEAAQVPDSAIGRVEWHGGAALVELPDPLAARALAKLDGFLVHDRPLKASLETRGESERAADHFGQMRRGLDLEGQAQAQRMLDDAVRHPRQRLQQLGYALLDLAVVDEDAGLGGRSLVRLQPRARGPLPR